MREWVWPVSKYILYALVAAVLLDRALASQRETLRLRQECRRITAEIARIRAKNARHGRTWNALRFDPFYIERVLRGRYGYRRPGEVEPERQGRLARQDARRARRVVAYARGRPRTPTRAD